MAIFRVNKNTNYTVMSNYHFKDKNLSLKAKGLLSQMLSLPPKWDYTVAGLCAINKENKTAIQSTLKELEEHGYLKRTRSQNNKGQFDYIYDIFEKPWTENLVTDNRCTENVPQLNTNKLSTKVLSTNNNTTTNVVVENNQTFGNPEINEMYKFWQDLFGYMPKNTPGNRRAVYNMLRAKDKGKQWLIDTMRLLKGSQDDKYAGSSVHNIANFEDLSRNYDKIWKWGSDKAQRLKQSYDNIEI